jgi:hypothetical protein
MHNIISIIYTYYNILSYIILNNVMLYNICLGYVQSNRIISIKSFKTHCHLRLACGCAQMHAFILYWLNCETDDKGMKRLNGTSRYLRSNHTHYPYPQRSSQHQTLHYFDFPNICGAAYTWMWNNNFCDLSIGYEILIIITTCWNDLIVSDLIWQYGIRWDDLIWFETEMMTMNEW